MVGVAQRRWRLAQRRLGLAQWRRRLAQWWLGEWRLAQRPLEQFLAQLVNRRCPARQFEAAGLCFSTSGHVRVFQLR